MSLPRIERPPVVGPVGVPAIVAQADHPGVPKPVEGECQWFAGCHDPATALMPHGTLDHVPICDFHIEWVGSSR